jgi:DNA-binding NarL/FixJ family response regulator
VNAPPEPISVVIVDDHPLYREGLARAVEAAEGLELIGAARSIEEFESLRLRPTVVLLDLHLPGISGSDGVERVVEAGHRTLVVSAAASAEAVVDAMGAGAAGYVIKTVEAADLVTAVRVVAAGGTYVSPTLAAFLLQARHQGRDRIELTSRELQVLELVADGETDQEIAAQLVIAVATVRSHLDRIRDKTGVRRRVKLAELHKQINPRS